MTSVHWQQNVQSALLRLSRIVAAQDRLIGSLRRDTDELRGRLAAVERRIGDLETAPSRQGKSSWTWIKP